MEQSFLKKRDFIAILITAMLFIVLFWTSVYSYLLFHSLAELFSVVIAFGIFMIAWNGRRVIDNSYILFIGIAYLFVGSFDLLHTLAYKGMHVFPGFDTNLPTQLWIIARYMESISLVGAAMALGRNIKANVILYWYCFISLILFAAVFFWDVFPVCYVEGRGLTPFKLLSEYINIGILLISIVMIFIKRHLFDATIFKLLITAIATTIFAELAFTFYVHAYGVPNLIGHFFKIISFFLIYRAIVVLGLTKPYRTLFRNLKKSEASLKTAQEKLEVRVAERTADLSTANVLLSNEIAEHKLSKEQLAQSELLFKSIYNGIADPLIVTDKNMVVQVVNKAALAYYGIASDEEVIGKPCYEVFMKKTSPCESCEVYDIILNGNYKNRDRFERKCPRDPNRLEIVYIYPLETQQGELEKIIIRIHDITQRKALEKKIIRNEKLASLGTLVSSVAHEINNPNNFISFNIPILKDYITETIPIIDAFAESRPDFEICNLPYHEFRDDIFNLLSNIKNGSDRISAFVSNLREYSKDRNLKSVISIDLHEVVERVMTICNSTIKRSVKSFIKKLPEDIPPIKAEPYIIEQILINFITNAAQAADKEDSWVKLEISIHTDKEDYIVIEVSDNGSGIDEKTQLKIFDPFFTTKSMSDGSGLGLYVCHTLANRLNGRIDMESEPGKGSTFRLFLPMGNHDV